MRRASLITVSALVVACAGPSPLPATAPATRPLPAVTSGVPLSTTSPAPPSTTSSVPVVSPGPAFTVVGRPDWLGSRPLPLRPDGFGEAQPTPPELVDRRLQTVDVLPAPAGTSFEWTVVLVPDEVVARSTWTAECPVGLDELRYLTVTFWGFDSKAHAGELIVHEDVAEALVAVFHSLFDSRFPMEEMRVASAAELELPPTGDGNNTSSFECRAAVGSGSWSQHAFGMALDVNPFHNPYVKGDLVLPELASAYLDREWVRPGMILPEGPVVETFGAIGWGWGGDWQSLKDFMHFSASGR